MRQLRWYVSNQQQDGEEVTQYQRNIVIDLMTEMYGGATLYSSIGFWTEDEGKLNAVPSAVFEVITDDAEWPSPNAATIADKIREITNQKAVMYTVVRINGGYANGEEEENE